MQMKGFISLEVERVSPFSGKTNSRSFLVRPQDLEDYNNRSKNIQNCFPYLSADDREFIMTGITAEEWEETFGK